MSEREQWLVNIARECARFLDYKTFGNNDRIQIARELHAVLMEYEDVVPCHQTDLEEWRKRQEALVLVGDPRR